MSGSQAGGPITLKPNKPEPFDGRRDFLMVNTWLYKMEQYLAIVQLSNPGTELGEGNKIIYASTFFTGTAAVWWFTLVKGGTVPTSWEDFKKTVIAEFVPPDHVRRARDKLRGLKHNSSVSKYLAEFRNVTLTIPDMSDGEKMDRFCTGLKYEIRVEVLKSAVATFDKAASVALRIDSALWTASKGSGEPSGGQIDSPVPMEIGNFEKTLSRSDQRQKDLDRNACFTCHRIGCRPWKHKEDKERKVNVNNLGAKTVHNANLEDGSSGSDSEN